MRRTAIISLVSFIMAFGLGTAELRAAESPPSLKGLAAWDGAYPFDKKDGRNMWQHKGFRAQLKKALGPDRYKVLTQDLFFGPAQLIQRRGDFLLISICKKHACYSDGAQIFVNMAQGQVSVCWTSSSDPAEWGDQWLSSQAPPRSIGREACAQREGFDLYTAYQQGGGS